MNSLQECCFKAELNLASQIDRLDFWRREGLVGVKSRRLVELKQTKLKC